MPGVREEIHGEAGYGVVSLEEPLGAGVSSAGVDGGGGGYLHIGAGAGDRGRDDAEVVDAGGAACGADAQRRI